ncbi:hypothetical protein ACRRTK_017628 [Alexandromys fortis]
MHAGKPPESETVNKDRMSMQDARKSCHPGGKELLIGGTHCTDTVPNIPGRDEKKRRKACIIVSRNPAGSRTLLAVLSPRGLASAFLCHLKEVSNRSRFPEAETPEQWRGDDDCRVSGGGQVGREGDGDIQHRDFAIKQALPETADCTGTVSHRHSLE